MEKQIIITVESLLWVLGIIITLGGATAVISRWTSPYRKLKEDVKAKVDRVDFDNLKAEVVKLKNYQNTDHEAQQKAEKGNEIMYKCVLALIDHELTNNSIDKLKKAKDEMQNYLIEK